MSSPTVKGNSSICTAIVKKTGLPCTSKASYTKDGKPVCGRHKGESKEKPQGLQESQKPELQEHFTSVEQAMTMNKEKKQQGSIMCCKLGMFSKYPLKAGYLNVYPNFKHKNKADGLGLPALSPKSLGPVDYEQKGAPLCRTIEGFMQYNKVFPFEVDEKGQLKEEFFKKREEGYCSVEPQRHKYGKTKTEHLKELKKRGVKVSKNDNVNIPLFAVVGDKEGQLCKYTYGQSRWFYCTFYEQLAMKTKEYADLVARLKAGYNLQIVGYDGYELTQSHMRHYQDESRPYGHEVVLCALLRRELTGEEVPWKVAGKPQGELL